MNKAMEEKSAAARREAEAQLNLKKKAAASLRQERENELKEISLKTARLRALRLAKEAADLAGAAAKAPRPRVRKSA